eukprot:4979238-Alexandrium_andersonii.AAC.1
MCPQPSCKLDDRCAREGRLTCTRSQWFCTGFWTYVVHTQSRSTCIMVAALGLAAWMNSA